MTDLTGSFWLTGSQSIWYEGVDRFDNPYFKELRFSNAGEQTRYLTEYESLVRAMRDCDFRANGRAVLRRVVRHTHDWGVARLHTTIRETVHEVEDIVGQNRTDFGLDVGVTQGAPYNGVGY